MTVSFQSLPIGARFTHEQFGEIPFTKVNETTCVRPSDIDGELEEYQPQANQPVDVAKGYTKDFVIDLQRTLRQTAQVVVKAESQAVAMRLAIAQLEQSDDLGGGMTQDWTDAEPVEGAHVIGVWPRPR